MKVAHSPSPQQATLPEWEQVYNERLDMTLKKISNILHLEFSRNPFRSLRRRFVLAHAPRVGSHLLCELLLDYGAVVEEFFEMPRLKSVSLKNNFHSIGEFCDWLIEKYTRSGVFGVSGGVKVLAPLVLAGEIPEFISEWRFVHLTRDDFVARAVSELIARRTGAFKSTKAPSKVITDEDYDAAVLRRLIDGTLTFNAAWEGAFKTYHVEPYRLTYETLCADPASAVADVAAHLRLDRSPFREDRFLAPKLEKQATSLNSRWAERFRAENQAFCASRAAGDFAPQKVRALGE